MIANICVILIIDIIYQYCNIIFGTNFFKYHTYAPIYEILNSGKFIVQGIDKVKIVYQIVRPFNVCMYLSIRRLN